MGSRGPLPRPMSGRTLRGLNTLGRRGKGPPGPPVDLGRAKMPRHLSPEARKFWRTHAPALERRGVLTGLDEMAFAALCEAWAMVRLCEEILQRDGIILVGLRGKVSSHPLVREKAKWEKEFIAWAKEFGMTPSSRRRLGLPEPEPEDDEFFRVIDGGRKTPEKPE